MEPNVPATTQEPAVPAVPARTDLVATPSLPPARPRQNVATGLFPLALGTLVLVFLGLALWTLMTTTGSGI